MEKIPAAINHEYRIFLHHALYPSATIWLPAVQFYPVLLNVSCRLLVLDKLQRPLGLKAGIEPNPNRMPKAGLISVLTKYDSVYMSNAGGCRGPG